ncbi:MAG TPA: twin-arginine translocase subunit TatC [Gemmatimonadaceae bacterium]|nr:twin-arginine translocase subunit TatC [Gemmatimonadaceae bacterium]
MRDERSTNAEMPFLDHLEELRWRIIWSLAAIALAVALGFFLVLRYDVIARLEAPILPYLHGHHVIATHPADGLQITVSAAMWIGAVVAFPVILYQAWLFLSPALYVREKRLLIAALSGGIALFVAGALFAYAVVLPVSLPWMFQLFGTALEPMITAESYFGLVFSMVLSFGVAFELPVVVLLLAAAGLVTPQFLSRYRRHAIVLIITVGAFLTPGDFVSTTLALAVPLYLLYELSVVVAFVIWRRRPDSGAAIALLLTPFLLWRQHRLRHVAA